MGVTMSKSENSYSEELGNAYVKDSPTATFRSDSDQSEKFQNQTSTHIAAEGESEVVEMLCADDDDDTEETAWKDIYQRLKSNKSLDLHNARPDVRPIFTSSVNERKTRITSANFSPHAVVLDKTRPHSVISPLEETMNDNDSNVKLQNDDVDENQDNSFSKMSFTEDRGVDVLSRNSNKVQEYSEILKSCSRNTDVSYNIRYGSSSLHSIEKDADLNEASGVSFNIEAPDNDDVNWNECSLENSFSLQENLLTSSSKSFGYLSPQPFGTSSNCEDEDGWDPFDGLGFPRERTSSFGSASIVSVKDFKDESYNEYFYEIRRCIRNYGYFEKFPSPSLLRDAQRTYRQLSLPTPVNDDGKVLPHPPKESRDDVFGKHDYEEVDQRAIFAPEALTERKLADVAKYLCSGLEEDVQKIRAIYSWVTMKQMSKENMKDSKSRKSWCKIFRKLCRLARIETKLVHGIIRDQSYVPGEDLEKFRGCWVSALVNQSWWVVNPVVNGSNGSDNINSNVATQQDHLELGASIGAVANHHRPLKDFDGFFKNTEEFIFNYLPDTDYWQLLARPVSKNEFTDMAVLGDGFFKLQMKLVNQEKSTIRVDSESVLISLRFPDKSLIQFEYNLHVCRDGRSESEITAIDGKTVSLERFVFLETHLEKAQVNIRVQFPQTGSYIFNLHGHGESSPDTLCICSYCLVYSHPKCSQPLPYSSRPEWGPGVDTNKLGLVPISHKTGEIIVDKKVTQIAFHDKRKLQFKYELRQDGNVVNRDDIRVSFLRNNEEDIVFVLDMEPAIIGIFTLNLFAKQTSNKQFKKFCTYLVKKLEFWHTEIPNSTSVKKATTQMYNFRHEEAVENKPTIVPDVGHLHLTLNTSQVSNLLVELKYLDKQELNFSEHARHWIMNDIGHIDLNFPRAGKYKFRVLGRCRETNHMKTLHMDSLLVRFPSARWSPFPKTLEEWNSYYKIEVPLSQHLLEKENIKFRLIINGAHDVAVLGPNGWYHMELEDEVWTGNVQTGPRSTRCRLLARFEIGSEKFTELLMFKVISSDDQELLDERQRLLRSSAIEKAANN